MKYETQVPASIPKPKTYEVTDAPWKNYLRKMGKTIAVAAILSTANNAINWTDSNKDLLTDLADHFVYDVSGINTVNAAFSQKQYQAATFAATATGISTLAGLGIAATAGIGLNPRRREVSDKVQTEES